MEKWLIPVSWEVFSTIYVEAETPEEALEIAKERIDDIPLGKNSYIDGSYTINQDNAIEEVQGFYPLSNVTIKSNGDITDDNGNTYKNEGFLSVEMRDVIKIYDPLNHDFDPQLLLVESIDKDKEYATATNPDGVVMYGKNISHIYDEDGMLCTAYENNFIEIVQKGEYSLLVYDIEWDTDNQDVDLPSFAFAPKGMTDENKISDWLSDTYGFCHKGFRLEGNDYCDY